MKLIAGVLLLLTCVTPVTAQSLLRGRVLRADTAPLGSVHVEVTDSAARVMLEAVTDSTGSFRIYISRDIKPELFFLSASLLGYTSIERAALRIKSGESVSVDIRMDAEPTMLPPITVVARRRYAPGMLQEYQERAKRIEQTGLGRLLDRSDLDRLPHMTLAQAVTRFAGVRLVPITRGGFVRESVLMRGGCTPAVYLDGMPLSPDEYSLISTNELEGVEVYRGPGEVPPEYASRAADCGVILAWSRFETSSQPLTWKRVGLAAGLILLVLML